MPDEAWHVYVYRATSKAGNPREWCQAAWADDLPLAQSLFLQACASTRAAVRLVHDNGAGSADDGFDRSVVAERVAR